jgi:hypothetical protein
VSCTANPLRSESGTQIGITSLISVPLAGLSTSRLNWQQGTNTATTTQEVIRLSGENALARAGDMTQQQKLAAAMSKAGIVNPAAWAAAGVHNANTPQAGNGSGAATQVAPEEFDLHPPVVLMRGSHNPAFFMSWRSQRDVVKALGWKSTLMIWGGPALTVLCVYILLNYFNAL